MDKKEKQMITFRTKVDAGRSSDLIGYADPVLFLGSCFATEIGSMFLDGKMPAMINPAGTVFNPVSVLNTLDSITYNKRYTIEDLHQHDSTWFSFSHYTEFSSRDPEKVLDKINSRTSQAHSFLSGAKYLFITFGTARVYVLKETGKIVSNCHKLPHWYFRNELLKVEDIIEQWNKRLERLKAEFPALKVIFTISPVRHWKDGPYGNQVSKSVLFLAIEELLKHSVAPGYFPAYEILIDELRDYRFYAEDMLHPSSLAVDYIWEKFSASFFDESTAGIWKDVSKLTRAMRHKISEENVDENRKFAENMLARISRLETESMIDFSKEKEYFRSLM